MGTPSKTSAEQAENFHVLPKDSAAREQTPAATNIPATPERDAEAGSLIGLNNTGEPERLPADERSTVS